MILAVTNTKFENFQKTFNELTMKSHLQTASPSKRFQNLQINLLMLFEISDYLESNLTAVSKYQFSEEPNHIETSN